MKKSNWIELKRVQPSLKIAEPNLTWAQLRSVWLSKNNLHVRLSLTGGQTKSKRVELSPKRVRIIDSRVNVTMKVIIIIILKLNSIINSMPVMGPVDQALNIFEICLSISNIHNHLQSYWVPIISNLTILFSPTCSHCFWQVSRCLSSWLSLKGELAFLSRNLNTQANKFRRN
jgi:hypothetical protein